ncbi:MAG: citrate/2-methylcitrate synthase [Methylacidiphilales bacterium]|nr:citrate/2-methylcitrate synthase [Candidatus Methylacidiphilales bacterium]
MNSIPYIPGLDDVPAKKSSVSSLDGEQGILAYRGYRIEELASQSNFEETAWLLLYGELPTKVQLKNFKQAIRTSMKLSADLVKVLKSLPKNTHPMKVLQVAVASAALKPVSVAKYQKDPATTKIIEQQCIAYLGIVGAIVAGWQRVRQGKAVLPPKSNWSFAQNFYYQMFGRASTEAETRMVDSCLVLHAEHTMNASTFATMVCGSTLAELPFVVATGVGTLAGPLHGGANERVIHMLHSIKGVALVRDYIKNKLEKKEVIWGMGHREYKVKDPRAKVLQKLLVEFEESKGRKPPKDFLIALEVEKVCEELLGHKGVFPNVDFYSGILYRELGIPIDQYTPIFAVSRIAGWLAHWREQIVDNRIFRPTQLYQGSSIRNYSSIAQRS